MSRSRALCLTLSTTSAVPRGASAYAALAAKLGLAGIELDATTWWSRRLPGLPPDPTVSLPVPITSIWLSQGNLLALQSRTGKPPRGAGSPPLGKFGLVVQLNGSSDSAHDQAATQRAYELVHGSAWVHRLTLAIPAVAGEGGRAHLTRLHGLKRLAEEWGVTVALDIGPRTDVRWEAEAAVQALGTRLSMVRLRARLERPANAHADVARRTLRAAFELGFNGTIALSPPTPFWTTWHTAAVERDLVREIDAVERLFLDRPTPIWLPDESHSR